MSVYADQADLVTAYSAEEILAISDRDNTGAIDTAVVAAALSHADAVIDASLAARYQLPMVAVPGILKTIALQITRHHLYRFDRPDAVTQDEKAARAMLADLAAGRSQLSVAGIEPGTADAALPQVLAPDKVFSRDKLESF